MSIFIDQMGELAFTSILLLSMIVILLYMKMIFEEGLDAKY